MDEFFFELATYVFFVMTASKFRPAVNNPYLLLSKDDDEEDIEMDRAYVLIGNKCRENTYYIASFLFRLTQTGLTETVVQVGRHKHSNKQHVSPKIGTEEENESLVSAEGSHELD